MLVTPQNIYAYIYIPKFGPLNRLRTRFAHNYSTFQYSDFSGHVLSWFLNSCFYAPFILHVFHTFYTLLIMIRVQGSLINLLHYYYKRCKLYSACLTCNSSGAIFIHYVLGQCQFCHGVCQLTIHMCVHLNCHVNVQCKST